MNFQIQLTRDTEAVPLVRDYMLEAERAGTSRVVRAEKLDAD